MQLKRAQCSLKALPRFFYNSGSIGHRKVMSYRSITYNNDPLDEAHVKVTVSNSENHLQNLKESSRILQK